VKTVSAVMAFEVVVPLTAGATLPMPWSMENVSASVVAQARIVVSPVVTDAGVAVSVQVGVAGGGVETVMVTAQWAVPPAPIAVAVYVVVVIGETDVEPLATGVDVPTPLSIVKDVAFADVHESVAELPLVMDAGFAESVQETAGGGDVVTLTFAVQ